MKIEIVVYSEDGIDIFDDAVYSIDPDYNLQVTGNGQTKFYRSHAWRSVSKYDNKN